MTIVYHEGTSTPLAQLAERQSVAPLSPAGLEEVAAAVKNRLGGADLADPDGQPSRPSMRKVLELCFPQISGFDAFIEKQFPQVFRQYSLEMGRTTKTNTLFERCETSELLAKLAGHPEFEPHRHMLSFELNTRKL